MKTIAMPFKITYREAQPSPYLQPSSTMLRLWEDMMDARRQSLGVTRVHVNHDPGDEDRS